MIGTSWYTWLQTNGQLVFSALLIGVTILLWMSTRRAAKAAESSADAAKSTAQATQDAVEAARQQAHIAHAQMLISIQPHVTPQLAAETKEEQPPARVKLVNTGGVAHLVSLTLELDGIELKRDLRSYTLAPGAEYEIPPQVFDDWAVNYKDEKALHAAPRFDRLAPDVAGRYVKCAVQYQDLLGQSWDLRFDYRGKRPDIQSVTVQPSQDLVRELNADAPPGHPWR